MELTRGRLKATLIAGKIPETDEALMILSARLSTIGQGYRIEKAISERSKPIPSSRKISPDFTRRAVPLLIFSGPT